MKNNMFKKSLSAAMIKAILRARTLVANNKWIGGLGFLMMIGVEFARAQCTPTITANPSNATVCQGSSVTLTASPSGNDYTWYKNGSPVNPPNSSHIYIVDASGDYYAIKAGCSQPSNTITVTVNPNPTANFTAADNVCASIAVQFTNQSTGTALSYSWNFNDPSSSSNISNVENPSHLFETDIIGCGTKTFNVQLTVTDGNQCSATITKSVSVKRIPDVTLITPGLAKPFTQCSNISTFNMPVSYNPAVSGCTNSLYQISWGDEATPGTFSWTNTSPPSMVYHLYNGQGTWQLQFKVTGQNGCINQKSYNVFNGSNPSISFGSPGNTNGCVPYTVNFPISNYSSNAQGTYYVFNFGDGIVETLYNLSGSSIQHTYNIPSCGNIPPTLTGPDNTFTAMATAINACNSTGTTVTVGSIAVSQQPSASIQTNLTNDLGCINQPVSFSFTAQNACQVDPSGNMVTKFNVTWNFGDGSAPVTIYDVQYTSLSAGFSSHTYTNPGNYTVTLILENLTGGCTNTVVTKNICISPSINVSSVGFNVNATEGCKPLTITTTNTSTIPNDCGTLTWNWTVEYSNSGNCGSGTGNWSFASGSATSASPKFTFSDAGIYTLRLTASNNCGSAYYEKVITVRDKPQVTLASLPDICAGESVTPQATYTNCYGTITSYNWSFPGGTPSSSTASNPGPITFNNAGNYTISVSASNACGSSTVASQPLTVKPRPTPSITSGPSSVCVNSTATYTTQANMSSYQWTVTGGQIIQGGNTNTITVNWTTIGNGSVAVNYISTNGCPAQNPTIFPVTVHPLPTVTLSGDQQVCQGSNGTYTTEAGMSNYQWQVSSGGQILTPNPSTKNVISVKWNNSGPQWVKVNYSNSNNCSAASPAHLNVNVNPNPIPPILTGNTTVCHNETVTYTTTPGMSNYSWAISPVSAGIISNGNTAQASIQWINTGTTSINATLTVTYTDANGCTGTSAGYQVIIKPKPTVTASPASQSICPLQSSAAITLSSNVSSTSFSWIGSATNGITLPTNLNSGTGNTIPSSNAINNTTNTAGTITFTISSVADGCQGDQITATIQVKPKPVLSLNPPTHPSICSGTSTQAITFTSTQNNTTYTLEVINPSNVTGTQLPGPVVNIPSHTLTLSSPGIQEATVTYKVTPMADGCPGDPQSVGITVKPLGQVSNIVLEKTICSGSPVNIALQSAVTGTQFSWTASLFSGSATGFGNGSGTTINDILINTGTTSAVVKYEVTPTANNCQGTPKIFTVTVLPVPQVIFSPASQVICAGTSFQSIQMSTNLTGQQVSYTWTASASSSGVTGFPTSGNGSSLPATIQGTTINSTSLTPETVTFTVTPNLQQCNYTNTFTATVTVNPSPSVTANPVSPQTICSGQLTLPVQFSSNVQNATFSWTATASSGNIQNYLTSGNGNIPAQQPTNNGNTLGWIDYSITPSASNNNLSCPGQTLTYRINVNPIPVIQNITPSSQTKCPGSNSEPINLSSNVPNTTYSWTGTASGTTLPTGFQSGTSNPIPSISNLQNLGNNQATITFTIVPTANNCQGAQGEAIIYINPKPTATLSPNSHRAICSGGATTPITILSNLSGTVFNLTSTSNPTGITGVLPSQTVTSIPSHTLTLPPNYYQQGTVNYSIIPVAGGCSCDTASISIPVKPLGDISNTQLNKTICSGDQVNLTLTSNVVGTTFTWTAELVGGNVTGFTSGSGITINDILINQGNGDGVVEYTVSPNNSGCQGVSKTFHITVKPKPNVIFSPAEQTICSGTTFNNIMLSSSVTGQSVSYAWSGISSNPGITGFTPSGSGNIITGSQVISTLSSQGSITYTVTPNISGCNYTDSYQTVIFINPNPGVQSAVPPSQSVCSGTSTQEVTLIPTVQGTVFSWTASGSNSNVTGFQAQGIGNIPAQNLQNNGNTPATVTYHIIPATQNTVTCEGVPYDYQITVNPIPVGSGENLNQTVCSGNPSQAINLSSNVAGTTYNWSVNYPSYLTPQGATSGTTTQSIAPQVWLNTGNQSGTAQYSITPVFSGCQGQKIIANIAVQPVANITNANTSYLICSDESINIPLTSNVTTGVAYTWEVTLISGPTVNGAQNQNTPTSTAVISQALQNTGNTNSVLRYRVYAWVGDCPGPYKDFTVTVKPKPVVTTTGPYDVCSGNSTNIPLQSNVAGAQFTWQETHSSWVTGAAPQSTPTTGAIQQTLSIPEQTPGIVTYIISASAAQCIGPSKSVSVSVNPNPIADAGNDQTVNYGTPVTLSGINSSGGTGTLSYAWAPCNPPIIPPCNTPTVTTNNLTQTTTFTLTVTDAKQCATSDGVTITVQGSPVSVTATANPSTACFSSGLTVTLHAQASGGAGGNNPNYNYIFSWEQISPPGTWTASGATVTVNPPAAGTYVYKVTAKDEFNNQATANVTFVINPLPNVYTLTASNNGYYCSDGSGVTLSLSGSQSGISYQLKYNESNLGNPVQGTGSSLTFPGTYAQLGNYTVVAVNTNTLCQAMMNGNIQVQTWNPPSANASANPPTIPNGAWTTLSASGTGGQTPYSWNWLECNLINTLIHPCSNSTVRTSNLTTNTTYHVVVTDNNGCDDTATVEVVVTGNALALVCSVTPQVVCNDGTPLNLSALATGGNTIGYQYSWTGPGGWTSNQQNTQYTPTNAGSYSFTATVTDGFNSVTCNTNATVNPLPQIFNVGGGGGYCQGGSGKTITLSGSQSTPATTYQVFRNGVAVGSPKNGTGSALSFGPYTESGTYSIKATHTVTGCEQWMNGEVQITIWPNPVANAGTDIVINGYNMPAQLTGNASGGTSPYSRFEWLPQNKINGSNYQNNPTGNSFTVNTIQLTNPVNEFVFKVLDANNCESRDTVIVSVMGQQLQGTISAVPNVICNNGASIQLNATASNGSGGPYTFTWSSVPAGPPIPPIANPVVNPTQNTQYIVNINDGFSTIQLSVNVTVNPLPNPYQVTGGGEYCFGGVGLPIQLNGSQQGIRYKLFRDNIPTGDSLTGTGAALSFGNKTQAGVYTVLAKNPLTGCQNPMNGNTSIIVNPLPVATASAPNSPINHGISTTLIGSATQGTPPYSYQWQPVAKIATGANSTNATTSNLYANQWFSFIVNDSKQCKDTAQVLVEVQGDPLSVQAIATPDTICQGQQVVLSATGLGGNQNYTYTWKLGNTVLGNTQVINVSPTSTSTYTVTVDDGYNTASTQVTVIVNPLPQVFTLLDGGAYCEGGQGIEVVLNGSQPGVAYSLLLNGQPTGQVMMGSAGSPVNFGYKTVGGDYTVRATIPSTGCTLMMNGTATVVVNPLPQLFAVTGGGSYPSGGVGVPVGLNGSQSGINYMLNINGVPSLTPPGLSGTGNPLDFGNQTEAGEYTVVATNAVTGCQRLMQGSVTVIINPYPNQMTVIGGGPVCAGDPGVKVGLNDSEIGVRYILYKNNDSIATAMGTGDSLMWGPYALAGIYTVKGINTSNGLERMMIGQAIITVNPLPLAYSLVPSGVQCQGTQLYISGSQSGVYYVVYRWSSAIDTVYGTGLWSLLPVYLANDTGLYHVTAVNMLTGCRRDLMDSTLVVPSPEKFNMFPVGIMCEGDNVWIDGSQPGMLYQLRRDYTYNVGAPKPGTGGPISFGSMQSPGVYRVIAINPLTLCTSWMNDSAVLYPAPIQFALTPRGDSCAPVELGLSGSQLGFTYELYNNTYFPPLSVIQGTGQPISFGPQNLSGTYKVRAINQLTQCYAWMHDSLTLYPRPVKYDVVPSGPVCTGTMIMLESSQNGVMYQLLRNNMYQIGTPIAGTGGPLQIGIATQPGTYQVIAWFPQTQCSEVMNGSVVVLPSPTLFTITPPGTHCAGTVIGISGTQAGFEYRLIRDNLLSTPVAILTGNGSMMEFGPMYLPGTYKVAAFDPVAACTAWMLDSVVIIQSPQVFTLIPAGANCEPTHIMLSGSELGITYELLKNGQPMNPPVIVAGTGGMLSFGMQMGGTYTARATTASLGCQVMMNGVVEVTPMPIVNLGNDTLLCSNAVYQANPFVEGFGSLQWTTSGDGVFSNPSQANTTYTPGSGDLANGSVTLSLTATGRPECPSVVVSDQLNINFHPLPIANAGPDLTACEGLSASLSGTGQNYSSVMWTTDGDGFFSSPSTEITDYLPGPMDRVAGQVSLTFTVWGTQACQTTSHSDVMVLTLQPMPIAHAGPDTIICESNMAYLHGSGLYAGPIPQWITTGDGVFGNPNAWYTTYTPGPGDKQSGAVHLVLKVSGINTCSSQFAFDTLNLYIKHLPVINAGPDIFICANMPSTSLSAQVSDYSVVNWETTGFGYFQPNGSLQSTYFIHPSDTVAGSVLILLRAWGTDQCIMETGVDSLTLSIDPLPVVIAGADTFSCAGAPVQVNARAMHVNGVYWETRGNGIFNDRSLLNPVYTPGSSDLTNGGAWLIVNGFGTASCVGTTDTDSLFLEIKPLPTAIISGIDTICRGQQAQFTLQLTGTPPWTVTVSNGLSSWTFNNIQTSVYQASVSPIVTTSYFITSVHDAFCSGTSMQGMATVYVNPKPVIYTVSASGNGFFCPGSPGCEITINGSQAGILYQLMRAGQPVGQPLSGTGYSLSFGWFNLPGLYYVIATNPNTGCQAQMNGQIFLIMTPEPDVDFTVNATCHNYPAQFTLTGSNIQQIVLFEWNFGDGNTATYLNAVNPSHIYQATGTFNVTLTVTDIYGCQTTRLHPVTVNPLPTALFAVQGGSCLGLPLEFTNLSTAQQPNYIASSSWNFGDGSTQTLQWPASQNATHTYAMTGNYNVTLTVTSSDGCQATYSQVVNITSGPQAEFIAGNACEDMSVGFTDISQPAIGTQIVGWAWDFGDPASGMANTSLQQNPEHVFAQPGTYPVKLKVISSNGCQDSVMHDVVVNPAPIAAFTATASCTGFATQFTDASQATGAPIISWNWNFGDGTAPSSLQNPSHTYTSAGIYFVNLTVTDANGCVASVTQPVTIVPGPTASFITSGNQACVGSLISFFDQSSTQTGYITQRIWNFGDGTQQVVNFPNSPNVTHSYSLPGTYLVTLKIITSLGCEALFSQLIFIQNGPIAAFQESSIRCQQSPVLFTNQSSSNGGASIISWSWNFGDPVSGVNNTSGQQNPTHTFALPGNYSVKLIIVNALGCIDSVIRQITVYPQPTALFTADSVCLGDTTYFVDQSTSNAGILTYWTWNFGDATAGSILQNPSHIYAAPGTFYPSLTVTNSYGCQNDTALPVYVRSWPNPAFSVSSTNCNGLPVHFTNQSTFTEGYITQWHWIFGDGTDTVVNFPSVPDVDHIYPFTGIYEAHLEVFTNQGCHADTSQLVYVVDSPVADFTTGAATCASQAVQFIDQSSTPGGIPTISWMWDFGDPASGIYNTSTQQNPMHIFTGTGVYNVKLIISNLNGCYDTVIKSVEISPIPVAQFSADSACLGTPTHFTDMSSTSTGTITNWLWNFGDGYTSTLQNPEHTYMNWGTYTVTLTVTNSSGCQNDTSMSVLVKPLPVAAFTYSGECAGALTYFTDLSATPQGNIVQWLWDFGDGATSSVPNPIHVYSTGGTFTVNLTVFNDLGCSSSYPQTVHIFNPPTANFNYNSVFCPAGQVSFQDLTVGNGTPVTWRLWNFGNGYSSMAANPVYVYPIVDSCYTVTLIAGNGNGCIDTVSKIVCVKPAFNFTMAVDASCTGNPTSFRPLNLAQGDSLLFVTWEFGDPASGPLNQSSSYYAYHTYQNAGIYFVKLKAWNSDYCVDSIYQYITVLDPPVADFTWQTQTPHCDSTITFSNLTYTQGAQIDSVVWIFGDGSHLTQYPPIPPAATHRYPAYGVYQVTLNAYVSNHCSDHISKTVKVKCLSADYVADTSACQNAELVFNDISSPPLAITKWLWLYGDGNYEEYTSWKPFVKHTFLNPGMYYVKLIVQGVINGMPALDSVNYPVQIWPAPQAQFTATNLCQGDTVRFFNQSFVMMDSIVAQKWWFGDGKTSTLQHPGHLFPSVDTMFRVRLAVLSAKGCADTTESTIVLNPSPVLQIQPRNGLFCGEKFQITFTESSGITYPYYVWVWGDGDTLLTSVPVASHQFWPGEYVVKLQGSTESGCLGVDSTKVRVKPAPEAGIWVDKHRAPITEPVFHFEDLSQSPLSPLVKWQWMIDDSLKLYEGASFEGDLHKMLISSGSNNYFVIDTGYHKVSLWVTNLEGCADSSSVLIYLEPVLLVTAPNAFTPNHDNLNNTFKPHILNMRRQGYYLRIYNRWGQMVFETTNPDESWDGTFKGEPCNPGAYIWMVEYQDYNGKPESRKGSVMLLR